MNNQMLIYGDSSKVQGDVARNAVRNAFSKPTGRLAPGSSGKTYKPHITSGAGGIYFNPVENKTQL